MGKNIKIECPVCRSKVFDEADDWDICPVCGWENDGVQNHSPDLCGGANKPSLNQARAMWAEGKRVWSPED